MNSLSSTTAQLAHATGHLGRTALALYSADLLPFEIFAVIVSAALITGTILIIIKTGWFSLHVSHIRDIVLKSDIPRKHAGDAWAEAQKHFFAGDPNDLKMAVMEADTILNDALRYAGIHGVNLGDRLKNIKRGQIPNIEDIWAAHKLRNEIAHGMNITLKRDMAERALEAYEVALKNLGALEGK